MNCILYKNSGFNSINIPDSPSLLQQTAQQVKSSVIDCLQGRFLTSINVKINYSDVKDVDYVMVDDFYYIVSGITMLSYDVANISLIPDFITSAGGPSTLTILDGITERHHITTNQDMFGAYTEPDPLLNPAHVLKVAVGDTIFDAGGSEQAILIESSVDLLELGNRVNAGTLLDARTFEDSATSNTITVPSVPPVSHTTQFKIGTTTTETVGTALFRVLSISDVILKGIQACRDLGIENAIIAQYTVPTSMFDIYESGGQGKVNIIESKSTSTTLTGMFVFDYAQVRNKRLLYGENNKYGILTASGNSCEFNPEEIFDGNATAPSVLFKSDGRYNGAPFFSFDYYHGVKTTQNTINFFTNAAQGQEWRNLPLIYLTKSGSVLDTYHFESQRRSETSAYNYNQDRYLLGQIGAMTGAGGGYASSQVAIQNAANAGNIANYRDTLRNQNIMDAFNVAGNAVSMAQNEYAYNQYRTQYEIAALREMYDFGYSQSVVTPQIMFPFQTPTVRDYAGNGVVPYRFYYDSTDRTRIDKLLTAYGYKHTTQLETSFFNNRPHFNFVKANGVSVGSNLPLWWKTGITDQFSVGVRIWHVKPNPSYYTQNE